jgi:adenylate cyclase
MSAPGTLDAEELARRNDSLQEQLRAVSAVLRAVAQSEGLQPVLNEVVEAAVHLCEGASAQLYLVEDGLLRAIAYYGQGGRDVGPEYDKQHPHALDRTTIAGRAAVMREVAHIPDVQSDPEYAYTGPREFLGAGLGVPILFEDELIGVVAIVRGAAEPFSEGQIELVKTFADQAAIAIANARLLDAVERQRSELSRFVSPQVAELVSSDEGERMLAGHRSYISALFCDLRGFTAFTEMAEPEELFEVLREYHTALGELIPAYDGTLEHFAGDGLMVFFNDPLPVAEHELKAIRLALVAQERFAELSEGWRKRGTELGLGIGIATGYATLGRIGFEGRYDYGALGPVTNLASRLSTHAEPGQTLIAQRVFAAVEEQVEAEPVGELELKGFGRPVVAYEVVALR